MINKLERKFGRFAIRNLSMYIVLVFAISYFISFVNEDIYYKLVFSPYHIFHEHEIWRVFTWIFTNPGKFGVFTLIMMFFYFSIGTSIERFLGSFRYNLYIFTSLLLTGIGGLVVGAVQYFPNKENVELVAPLLEDTPDEDLYMELIQQIEVDLEGVSDAVEFIANTYGAGASMTEFLLIGIFLGFALIHSDAMVLLYFIIPFKVSWLAYFDILVMVVQFITTNNPYVRANIFTYLLAFFIMYILMRKSTSRHGFAYTRGTQDAMSRRRTAERKSEEKGQVINMPVGITRHKCAICGRSEKDDYELEFRFCSKCNGNYEYCKEHLYSHEHIQ